MVKIPKLRWLILGALFLSTEINYLSRLTLPVVAGKLLPEFAMTEREYSQVVCLFLVAYAFMYAGSGYIVDRLGARISLAAFVLTWSTAQILNGFARGMRSLASCQFVLGLAQPGNFPAGVKEVNEWFTADQRATGVGLFNAGTSLGAALSAPVAAFFTVRYGWRSAFFFTGSLGFVWVVIWLLIYPRPGSRRWLSAREDHSSEIPKDASGAAADTTKRKPNVLRLLRSRQCSTLILARFFTDPVCYFVLFWFPRYLERSRGFDIAMVGKYAWVPFLFEIVGYIFGGWLSGRLMRAGWSLPKARKTSMLVGACFLSSSILTPIVPAAGVAIAATCLVMFGNAVWVANLFSLPADLFDPNEVGTVTGFSGTGGSIGGIFATLGTGYIVTRFSYQPVFILAGLMPPMTIALVFWLLPDRDFQNSRGVRVSTT